ncbi:hypothetical protein KAR91_78055 [Candidatus Pacearchaeota archaeon]|nr:hypothetical protein [Candidatus Pacearchaeota archaeon]
MVRKDKAYYEKESAKWRRSANKQKGLREQYEKGIEKGIQLAKEARL